METKCDFCSQPIEMNDGGKWEHIEFNENCWAALPSSKPDIPFIDLDDDYMERTMRLAFG